MCASSLSGTHASDLLFGPKSGPKGLRSWPTAFPQKKNILFPLFFYFILNFFFKERKKNVSLLNQSESTGPKLNPDGRDKVTLKSLAASLRSPLSVAPSLATIPSHGLLHSFHYPPLRTPLPPAPILLPPPLSSPIPQAHTQTEMQILGRGAVHQWRFLVQLPDLSRPHPHSLSRRVQAARDQSARSRPARDCR